VRDVFLRNVSLFSAHRLPHAIEAYSDDFFADWRKRAHRSDAFGRQVGLGGPIAFAYIDGAHTYEASMADFRNVDAHLLPGGFVLLDDSGERSGFGSTRTAREAAALPHYEVVFRAPNYLLRKR
jgi:hypothetical protein